MNILTVFTKIKGVFSDTVSIAADTKRIMHKTQVQKTTCNPDNRVKYIKDNEILFFSHIPKTAGMCINGFINKKRPLKSNNAEYNVQKQFIEKYGKDINHLEYIGGHYNLAVMNKIKRKIKKIVVFRDPVERIKSQYYEYLRGFQYHSTIFKFKKDIRENCSFKYFISNKKLFNIYSNNKYAIYLSSDSLNCFSDSALNNINELTDRALNHIYKYDVVGMQDDMEKTILWLCYECGWKPPKHIEEKNITEDTLRKEKNSNLTKSDLEKLKKKLIHDYKLYDAAKRIFREKTKNLTYEKVLKNYSEVMYKTKRIYNYNYQGLIDYNSGWYNKYNNDGWYKFEDNYRWSGPETESEIDFSIEAKSSMLVSFRILEVVDTKILDNIIIIVNGEKINNVQSANGSCKFIIPYKLYKQNTRLTSIVIKINKTMVPNNYSISSQSRRKVGIAIDDFSVVKCDLNMEVHFLITSLQNRMNLILNHNVISK